MNAVEREPVETRVLNPNASEASYKPEQRSYRKTKLKLLLLFFFFGGILVGGVLVGGILVGGILSGGFYPGTEFYTPQKKPFYMHFLPSLHVFPPSQGLDALRALRHVFHGKHLLHGLRAAQPGRSRYTKFHLISFNYKTTFKMTIACNIVLSYTY